jgi:hypothetical protein
MNDWLDGSNSTRDDDLPVSIIHSRDTIVFGGNVEQDYRFLDYRFRAPDGEIVARVYLDDVWEVSIIEPIDGATLPDDVFQYLKSRFRVITLTGGPDGDRTLWRAPAQNTD